MNMTYMYNCVAMIRSGSRYIGPDEAEVEWGHCIDYRVSRSTRHNVIGPNNKYDGLLYESCKRWNHTIDFTKRSRLEVNKVSFA